MEALDLEVGGVGEGLERVWKEEEGGGGGEVDCEGLGGEVRGRGLFEYLCAAWKFGGDG